MTLLYLLPPTSRSWLLSLLLLLARPVAAASGYHVLLAPGTLTDKAATLLWDKQYAARPVVYEVLLNGKVVGTTTKTNYTLTQLVPATQYVAQLRQQGEKAVAEASLKFKTAATGKVYNILNYGAKNDTLFNSTKAIQAAIDACSAGGTVAIPAGTFVSGALFLKSNMTLAIAKGGTLKGSTAAADYEPMLLNRFEGWELKTYASLLNAGTLNRDGSYNVRNLRITGGGTIAGGGKRLADAMIKANGLRSRGRLICLLNCQNVSISHLTVTEPPSWTIHYIYSDNVTCHDLRIVTHGIHNGDGIDPDSSTNSYIFNCTFDTGDDCIAIKSGKNPEGFFVAKPTVNVRITDCAFIRGHGISIGSEMSGGVRDVLVQDCQAGALLHGLQIKGTKDRGGYVRHVTVRDCQLRQITIFSAVNYNNDGAPAPQVPTFEQFVFQNIDLSQASGKEPVIDINGFKDPAHRLRDVTFTNLTLPAAAKVVINDAERIKFVGISSSAGAKPVYAVANSTDVTY